MGDRAAWLRHVREDPGQSGRVYRAMKSGRWWTKAALAEAVGGSPHAMSARMSDLAKLGHRIEKRYAGNGVYLYRLRTNERTHEAAS